MSDETIGSRKTGWAIRLYERSRLPPAWRPRVLLLGASAFGLAIFLRIADELREPFLVRVDQSVLVWLSSLRRPWLNGVAIDITALGSVSLLVLLSFAGFTILTMVRDRVGILQLFLSIAGAGAFSQLAKYFFSRERPTIVSHLVDAGGHSFPSGHSTSVSALYITLAILVCREFPGRRERAMLFAMALVVITLVGVSRMYLGVHYPTDVVSGVSLGVAWALLVAGGVSFLDPPKAGG
jgi:undecaprenyl-diphosphatase